VKNAQSLPSSHHFPPNPSHPKSMIFLLTSRFSDLFNFPSSFNHSRASSSTSTSPRSSTDDSLLPTSASPHQTSFGDVFHDKSPYALARWQFVSSVHTPILFIILLFPLSTAFIWYTISTLPISQFSWPRTLSDLAQLGRELHGYSQSGPIPMAHVVAVLSITSIWKHAWSIPGSVVWNVLAGALFSPPLATLLLTTLTAIGSLCATLLSIPLSPILAHFFPRALQITREAIKGPDHSNSTAYQDSNPPSSPWIRLSILRLVGLVPWSGINIACGVCAVPFHDVFLGAFIGTMPWTAVTCQIGDILQTAASSPPTSTPQTLSSLLTSPDIFLKLVFLSFLSLAPILARDHLRAWVTPLPVTVPDEDEDARKHRWTWIASEWRKRQCSKSRIRAQRERQEEEEIALRSFVAEKEKEREAETGKAQRL